jgi:ubiquinone/menaquinone biosynthesis C-methylase UbiE
VSTQVDYDLIASSYDHRHADGGLRGPAVSLQALAQELGARRVLEVGCGTGHYLAGLQAMPAQLYGLDLSRGMLAQAQRREVPMALLRGRAGKLPFADATFDLVYCVNAIHHFGQQRAFVAEARRLLRPGGALAVIGMDPRVHRDRWYVYDYFEGTYEVDLARFPSWGMVLDWMAEAGFERVEWRLVERILVHKAGRAVLDDPFLHKDAVSQLSLLADEAYAAGLSRIKEALASAEVRGEALTFPTDLLLALHVGRVPG